MSEILDHYKAKVLPKMSDEQLAKMRIITHEQSLGGTAVKTPTEVKVAFDWLQAIQEEEERRKSQ